MIMIAALLICCSLLRIARKAPLVCSENMTRPEPHIIRGSRVVFDTRLPWYTSGFE